MAERKLLKPLNGALIRDPNTMAHIPEEGVVRVVSTYFNRRILEGGLEALAVPKPKTVKAKKKPNSEGSK